MQVTFQVESRLAADMARIGTGIREAADAAVLGTGRSDKSRARAVVASALGVRAGNTVDANFYTDSNQPLVYYRKERWSRGQGRFPLGLLETGGTLRPRTAKYLWIAQDVVRRFGVSDGKRVRTTPELFERKMGLDLHFVRQPNGNVYAFARDARLNSRGQAVRVKNVRRRAKLRASGEIGNVLAFVGVPEVQVQKRFDLGPVNAATEEELSRSFAIELGARKVID